MPIALRFIPRTADIEVVQTISAPIAEVFRAMTTARIIDEWGGGPARMQAKPGGKFSLWDGEMFGVVRELDFPRRLVYTLREVSWEPEFPDSIVSWTLREASRGTELALVHTGLPSRRIRELHSDGWLEYFLGPMKVYLEGEE